MNLRPFQQALSVTLDGSAGPCTSLLEYFGLALPQVKIAYTEFAANRRRAKKAALLIGCKPVRQVCKQKFLSLNLDSRTVWRCHKKVSNANQESLLRRTIERYSSGSAQMLKIKFDFWYIGETLYSEFKCNSIFCTWQIYSKRIAVYEKYSRHVFAGLKRNVMFATFLQQRRKKSCYLSCSENLCTGRT